MYINEIKFENFSSGYVKTQIRASKYSTNTSFAGVQKDVLYKTGKQKRNSLFELVKKLAFGVASLIATSSTGKKTELEADKVAKESDNFVPYREVCERFSIQRGCLSRNVRHGNIKASQQKVDLSDEKTLAFLEAHREKYADQEGWYSNPVHMGKKTLAKKMGVGIDTIKLMISKGFIELNEDGTIDITKKINKEFLEGYQKNKVEKNTRYFEKDYNKLQVRLKNLPIEYCILNNLIVVEEDGTILTQKEPNKSFLEKIDKEEITYKTYFTRANELSKRFGVKPSVISQMIKNGEIIKTPKLGIELNNEINKKAFEKLSKA